MSAAKISGANAASTNEGASGAARARSTTGASVGAAAGAAAGIAVVKTAMVATRVVRGLKVNMLMDFSVGDRRWRLMMVCLSC